MTEAEWLACTEPERMLGFLKGKSSERKLRLFALACCYSIWELIDDPRSQAAVEFADLHAEIGLARRRGLGAIRKGARAAFGEAWMRRHEEGSTESNSRMMAAYAVEGLLTQRPWETVPYNTGRVATALRKNWQSDSLRDIIGNPFRPLTVSPAWQTPQVVALAQAAYDQRELPSGTLDAARLAVLADALEEVGCDQADLLGHLRGPGPHVRGCWAVDLLLGKS
jgi:hypothetical protein